MIRTLCSVILAFAILAQLACGPKNLHELAIDLDKAAHTLNTAAKTNHSLWASGVISIEVRRQVAHAIHDANDDLLAAIDYAKTLNDSNFATGKERVKAMLSGIGTTLQAVHTGNAELDTLIKAAFSLIQTAIALTASVTKEAIPYLRSGDFARDIMLNTREVANG